MRAAVVAALVAAVALGRSSHSDCGERAAACEDAGVGEEWCSADEVVVDVPFVAVPARHRGVAIRVDGRRVDAERVPGEFGVGVVTPARWHVLVRGLVPGEHEVWLEGLTTDSPRVRLARLVVDGRAWPQPWPRGTIRLVEPRDGERLSWPSVRLAVACDGPVCALASWARTAAFVLLNGVFVGAIPLEDMRATPLERPVPLFLQNVSDGPHNVQLVFGDPFGFPLAGQNPDASVTDAAAFHVSSRAKELVRPIIVQPVLGASAVLTDSASAIEIELDPSAVPVSGFVQVRVTHARLEVDGVEVLQSPASAAVFPIDRTQSAVRINLSHIREPSLLNLTVAAVDGNGQPLPWPAEAIERLTTSVIVQVSREPVREPPRACQGIECMLTGNGRATDRSAGSLIEVRGTTKAVPQTTQALPQRSAGSLPRVKCRVVLPDGSKRMLFADPELAVRELAALAGVEESVSAGLHFTDPDGFQVDSAERVGRVCDAETVLFVQAPGRQEGVND